MRAFTMISSAFFLLFTAAAAADEVVQNAKGPDLLDFGPSSSNLRGTKAALAEMAPDSHERKLVGAPGVDNVVVGQCYRIRNTEHVKWLRAKSTNNEIDLTGNEGAWEKFYAYDQDGNNYWRFLGAHGRCLAGSEDMVAHHSFWVARQNICDNSQRDKAKFTIESHPKTNDNGQIVYEKCLKNKATGRYFKGYKNEFGKWDVGLAEHCNSWEKWEFVPVSC